MEIHVTTESASASLAPNATFSCNGVTVSATVAGCVVTGPGTKITMTSGTVTIDGVTVTIEVRETDVSTTGTKEVVAPPDRQTNKWVNVISIAKSKLSVILHHSTGLFGTGPVPLTKKVGLELRAIMDKCDHDLSLAGSAEVCLGADVGKLYADMRAFGAELIGRCSK